jgi:hypothetical protein
MDQSKLNRLLKDALGWDVCKFGWVPYSGLDTLTRQPDYYLMGYNPRMDPANRPLLETTNHASDWSAYTKQCWECKDCKPPCKHMDASGRLKHLQRYDLWVLPPKPEFPAGGSWLTCSNCKETSLFQRFHLTYAAARTNV